MKFVSNFYSGGVEIKGEPVNGATLQIVDGHPTWVAPVPATNVTASRTVPEIHVEMDCVNYDELYNYINDLFEEGHSAVLVVDDTERK